MNIRRFGPTALALAACLAAPAFAQTSTATVTTTTSAVDGRSYVVASEGLIVKQGVPGQTPTQVIVPNARTAIWGPVRAITNQGGTVTTVQDVYLNVPDHLMAGADFSRYQQLK